MRVALTISEMQQSSSKRKAWIHAACHAKIIVNATRIPPGPGHGLSHAMGQWLAGWWWWWGVAVVVVVVVVFSGPQSADSIGELHQKGVENVNFRPLKARFYMGLAPEGRIL